MNIHDDMIERVAMATYEAHPWGDEHVSPNTWEALSEDWKTVHRVMACASIEAMQPAILAERERVATHLFDREAFMTAVSGDGDPYVKVRFKTLKEMQSFHRELCNLAAAIRKGSE